MGELFVYSLIGGVFSLIGGIFLLWREGLTRRFILPLLAFGAGAFLGAVFLDILPEALEMVEESQTVLTAVLVGFLGFYILEQGLMRFVLGKHKGGNHAEHTESLPFLLIFGDSLHNFLDGIVIALAYTANPAIGLPTALAVAAHEVPQEIGDFSVLLRLGWKKSVVLGVNILQSLLTIPGVAVGYFLGQAISGYVPLLLGGTAGIFLYIAGSDIIPVLHHETGHQHFYKVVVPMVLAVILVLLV